jgi:hypothetical protein
MVELHNDALAAVNELIQGTTMRMRGLDVNSPEWQRFNIELEAYGRVLDVLIRLSERHPVGHHSLQLLVTQN